MTLIKDLIEIPEQVFRGDFVLRLSEGVAHPEETLKSYVVTPALAACFDDALGFIKGAVESRTSKASYLHGSFGSGKSHFMAVLHQFLQHTAAVRSVPELAAVVTRHDPWLQGKKFLLVPYHLIGARSLESAILGGYAEHVRQHHPDAPVPGVFLAERIFKDAERMRQAQGDAAFFSHLNAGRAASAGWGNLASGWDAQSFDEALSAPPRSENRSRLVGDLVERVFTAYGDLAGADGGGFVPLDEGLSIVSRHAQALGYDALILFLDELILWLASHAADNTFVTTEGPKLTKLVEAQTADRPLPIVSFVARQRDLRELVGTNAPGAQQLAFAQVLDFWEARFHKIVLEDRNLPAIAARRILHPKSEAARHEIDLAFQETTRVRDDVLSALLTSTGDREMFRKVYPFSPALVQALVAVSSVLQRERTALKVMLQLLVDQRDTLELGQLVPVGDLFDAISEGDEAFSAAMKTVFENAKRLYYTKLLPALETQHGLRWEQIDRAEKPRAQALRNDARLMKTLLIAALVPEVEALKALTPQRIAALNHGTIRSPIPGNEGSLVLNKLRGWAAQIGEIKIGEGPNPTISIQITGVDTDSIIENARVNDNSANRQRKVKELLFQEMGLGNEDLFAARREFNWRGTKREFEIVFANIRELPDESFRAPSDGWKLVIDYPFDADGYTPLDDLEALDRFLRRGAPTKTLAWLPSFLSQDGSKDLGTLTILDHIFMGERFRDYASHLSAVDQQAARTLLDNQRSQLRQRMIQALQGAYAFAHAPAGMLDESHLSGAADHFVSLDPVFRPQPPVAATHQQALENLLDQMLRQQCPAHPPFEIDIKSGVVARVYQEVRRALEVEGGRVPVEQPLRRQVKQIAEPLELGQMHETHFVLAHSWKDHFLKLSAQDPGPITVERLVGWIDKPRVRGLPELLQNMLILLFAEETQRTFYRHGAAFEATLDRMPRELELRQQPLPSEGEWQVASRRAGAIMGIAVSPLRNPANAARLSESARLMAKENREGCQKLSIALRDRLTRLNLSTEVPRLLTGLAVQSLLESLHTATPDGVFHALATAAVPTTEDAMGSSLRNHAAVLTALADTHWALLDNLRSRAESGDQRAGDLLKQFEEVLTVDEHATPLGPRLRALEGQAVALVSAVTEPAPPAPPTPLPNPQSGREIGTATPPQPTPPHDEVQRVGLSLSDAKRELGAVLEKLKADPSLRLDIRWTFHSDKKRS